MRILRLRFSDNKFLNLIKTGLKAGILDHYERLDSFIGVPQGGISPIIFNIYMHDFDKFVLNNLIPKLKAQSNDISEVTAEYSLLNSRTKHIQSRLKDEDYFDSKKRLPNFPTAYEIIKINKHLFQNVPFVRDNAFVDVEALIQKVEHDNQIGNKNANPYAKYKLQIRRAFDKNIGEDQYAIFDICHRKFVEVTLKDLRKEKLKTPYLEG